MKNQNLKLVPKSTAPKAEAKKKAQSKQEGTTKTKPETGKKNKSKIIKTPTAKPAATSEKDLIKQQARLIRELTSRLEATIKMSSRQLEALRKELVAQITTSEKQSSKKITALEVTVAKLLDKKAGMVKQKQATAPIRKKAKVAPKTEAPVTVKKKAKVAPKTEALTIDGARTPTKTPTKSKAAVSRA